MLRPRDLVLYRVYVLEAFPVEFFAETRHTQAKLVSIPLASKQQVLLLIIWCVNVSKNETWIFPKFLFKWPAIKIVWWQFDNQMGTILADFLQKLLKSPEHQMDLASTSIKETSCSSLSISRKVLRCQRWDFGISVLRYWYSSSKVIGFQLWDIGISALRY